MSAGGELRVSHRGSEVARLPASLVANAPRLVREARANIGTTEHSVLPEPVGAMTSVSRFCAITGEAFFCIGVRRANPSEANAAARRASARPLAGASPP